MEFSDLAWSFIGLALGWPIGFYLGYLMGIRRKDNRES